MGTVLGIDEGTRGATYGLRKHEKTYVTDKTYSLTYIVLADNTSESEDAILTSTGVPILWGYYNGTYCKKLAPKEKSSIFRHPVTGVKTILWYIKADFDSKLDPDQDEPPTSKPPTVRWHGETEEEVLEKDPITGDAVQTGAEEVILITTPIVLPVLDALGIDPIWYGVLLMINLELALITPPVGMNLFVIKGIAKAPMVEVVRGIVPYVGLMLLGLLLMLLFPGLSTWLPATMGYGR